ILVMSLFHGFNFFQMPSDPPTVGNLNLRRGITFLSLVAMTLFNLSQLPIFMEERLVYYKHSSAQSFRTYTYLLAHVLAGAPFSIIEATVWSIVVYFLAGFSLSDGGVHFWIFYAIMILTVLHGSAMVRFIAFSTRNPAAAAFFSALLVGPSVFLFIHLLIPQSLIRGYWIWVYRIDALQWAATMMQVNEFRSSKFNTPCTEVLPPTYLMPSSSVSNSSAAFPLLPLSPYPFCQAYPTEAVGMAYLKASGWNYDWIVFLIGPLVLVAWTILWTLASYICLLPGYYHQHFPHPKILPPSCLAAKSESKESACANGIRPATGIDVLPSEPRNGHDVAVEFGEIEATNGESEGWQAVCPPFQPVVMAWQNLSYKITSVHSDRDMEVLKSISGWVKPGEITGIVGGRGAGKTSLLNCLAGRKIRGRITGQLSVNGLTRDLESFIQCMAYIEGGHQHYPYLTVRESLMYRADLLLPQSVSRKSRNSFVDKILKVTRVHDLADYLVNDLLTSGGSGLVFTEKRIVLAMELSGNPSALFLDTPFIGMDMQQIVQFAEILDSVATGWGKAMVVSTNVPTVVQLNSFASVLMLRSGGEMVYFGPAGRFGSAIVEYFQSIPGTPMLPDNMNPISFLQYAMGEGVSESVAARDYAFEYRISTLAMSNAQHLRKLRRNPNSFYASEASDSTAAMPALPGSGQVAARSNQGRTDASTVLASEEPSLQPRKPGNALSPTSTPTYEPETSMKDTLQRSRWCLPQSLYMSRLAKVYWSINVLYWRNTSYTLSRAVVACVLGLVIGSLFFDLPCSTLLQISARAGFVFTLLIFGPTSNGGTVVGMLTRIRHVFNRERLNKQYFASTYIISFTLVEIPYLIVTTLIFIVISTGLAQVAVSSLSQFFAFWFSHFLFSLGITYLGFLLSVALPNPRLAFMLVPMVSGVWISTAGYVVPYSLMHFFFRPFYWTNPLQ
ncbi:unnamed protein product, partial [Closterium sp. Naga37s-1]